MKWAKPSECPLGGGSCSSEPPPFFEIESEQMLTFDPSKKIHEQITEETWCKGTAYRDRHGTPTGTSTACQACAEAWGQEIYGRVARNGARGQFRRVNGIIKIVSWNDAPERTFSEVLAAFKAADL